MIDFTNLKHKDPELFESMELELKRQQNNIELIASENFVSEEVMAAVGSHLTNKYAEGYPAHRSSIWRKISPSSARKNSSAATT